MLNKISHERNLCLSLNIEHVSENSKVKSECFMQNVHKN